MFAKMEDFSEKMRQKAILAENIMQIQVKGLKELPKLTVGNRIPKDYFVTSGIGESDVTIHAGSYHIALRDAGIEKQNIMVYSSVLSAISNKISKPRNLTFGSIMETIMACSNSAKGERATAGIIYGWLFDKKTGEKAGGLVCEYSDHGTEEHAKETLKASLNELYAADIKEKYFLKDIELYVKSFVPKKKYGTALVALCFVNHEVPVQSIMK